MLCKKIINEIFKTYWSLSVYFLSRDRDKFQEVVSRINGFSLRAPEILKNIIIYRALLIATIEADNLNMLTEICYLQKRYINDIGRGRCLNTSKTMSKYKYYNGMMLYVLVQTTIKTIELSQYDLTGFLIKYIASNYEFDILIEICEKIIDNNIVFDYELKRETLYDRLGVNFRINIDTAFYFFKKFLFLVGIQYKSRLEDGGQHTVFGLLNKACNRFWTDNKRFDDKYCLEKILSVKDKYGMLSLNKLGERWGDVKEECEYDKIIKEL